MQLNRNLVCIGRLKCWLKRCLPVMLWASSFAGPFPSNYLWTASCTCGHGWRWLSSAALWVVPRTVHRLEEWEVATKRVNREPMGVAEVQSAPAKWISIKEAQTCDRLCETSNKAQILTKKGHRMLMWSRGTLTIPSELRPSARFDLGGYRYLMRQQQRFG